MRNRWLKILAVLIIILLVVQFVPVHKTNPPITGDLNAPENVKSILKSACYDCHSYQTTWPWYSKIAPVSWLVASDVNEGREYLNFSTWDQYSEREKIKIMEGIKEVIKKDEMPLQPYRWMHSSARLSSADKSSVVNWAEFPAVDTEKDTL